MRRRDLLAAAAGLSGLAGCSTGGDGDASTPTASPVETASLASRGRPSTICREDPVDVGIYAIDEPAFADDWADLAVPEEYADGRLTDDAAVVGVERGGRARAYPVDVLWVHEIVNEDLGGPLMVTYCSLCRSGMVAERVVDGEATTFGVSGQLWRPPGLWTRASEDANRTFAVERDDPSPDGVRNTGNLVMFDVATGSYWSQLLARAICGPRAGERLPIVPAETTTWGGWRAAHPDGEVLLPPPHSSVMEVPFGTLATPGE